MAFRTKKKRYDFQNWKHFMRWVSMNFHGTKKLLWMVSHDVWARKWKFVFHGNWNPRAWKGQFLSQRSFCVKVLEPVSKSTPFLAGKIIIITIILDHLDYIRGLDYLSLGKGWKLLPLLMLQCNNVIPSRWCPVQNRGITLIMLSSNTGR